MSKSNVINITAGAKVQATREYERAPMAGSVLIHDEEHLYIAPISNIGAGGIFLAELMSIPKGSEVRMVIKSEALAYPIQAVGRVVRVEENGRQGMAVQFTLISSSARSAIEIGVRQSTSRLLEVA